MLEKFYENNPSKKLNGRRYCAKDDPNLNSLQRAHQRGEINLYAPLKAYTEQWNHITDDTKKFVSASPILGTKHRNDLPPVSVQWQQAYAAKRKGFQDG